jgi:hypothetical protein
MVRQFKRRHDWRTGLQVVATLPAKVGITQHGRTALGTALKSGQRRKTSFAGYCTIGIFVVAG